MTEAAQLKGAEILVVDGDPNVQRGLIQLLSPTGLHVWAEPSHERALEMLANKVFGVVVVDLDTPSPGAGLELVKQIRKRSPNSIVFVLVGRKSFEGAVAAFRAGAHDAIAKTPDQVDYLRARIVDALGDLKTRAGSTQLYTEVLESLEDFLRRFMEAERRALDLEDRVTGRPPNQAAFSGDVRVLVVDADPRLHQGLEQRASGRGFSFTLAQSGGEALDRVSGQNFRIGLVAETLPDLPPSMVIRSLKEQSPDTIVISYHLGGKLEIVDDKKTIVIVDQFTQLAQLTDRLDELAEAHRQTGRERRYLTAFRERHYEFLRHLAELRKKLEKAIEDSKDTFDG